MEVKRSPYRVITMSKIDAETTQEAIETAMALIDLRLNDIHGLSGPTPEAYTNKLRLHRQIWANWLSAVIDID